MIAIVLARADEDQRVLMVRAVYDARDAYVLVPGDSDGILA